MFASKKELISYEIDLEYKIAILKNKVDQSLKNQSKEMFLKYSKELNNAYQEREKAKKYSKTFFNVKC